MLDDPLTDATTTDLLTPSQWPMLEQVASAEKLAECVLDMVRHTSGRLVLNALVLDYILEDAPDISAERRLGQGDVVRHLLQMMGLAVHQRRTTHG